MAILGKDFQAKSANQKVSLVGCGALGCEYLKGLALMGVAARERAADANLGLEEQSPRARRK